MTGWLPGMTGWLPGMTEWLPGMTLWLPGMTLWLPGMTGWTKTSQIAQKLQAIHVMEQSIYGTWSFSKSLILKGQISESLVFKKSNFHQS